MRLILLMKCLEKVISMRKCPKNCDFQGKIYQKSQISRNIFLCFLCRQDQIKNHHGIAIVDSLQDEEEKYVDYNHSKYK